jgi:hypothetical protein
MSRKPLHENRTISSNGHFEDAHFHPTNPNGGMPLIRCLCGAKILLIPDMKAMNRALENHIDEHIKKNSKTRKSYIPPIKVRKILVEQILEKASEQRIT